MKQLEILYQDRQIVVINKPGGLLSVPGRGSDKQDCATAKLRQLFPEMLAQPAVHRLDMYTSGLMVMAVTASAHRFLSMQFERREVIKRYTALVEGEIKEKEGEIRLAYRLDPTNRPLQIYDPEQGKMGISKWQKIAKEGRYTRIEFSPLTGRTHQLRLHAAHPKPDGLGAPIVGDSLYGHGRDGDQMMLHACFLQFIHPETEETIEFSSAPAF